MNKNGHQEPAETKNCFTLVSCQPIKIPYTESLFSPVP
nr:hypothetical protein [Providencia rettgeri]